MHHLLLLVYLEWFSFCADPDDLVVYLQAANYPRCLNKAAFLKKLIWVLEYFHLNIILA